MGALAEKKAELTKLRAERAAEIEAAREEQELADLQALTDLEAEGNVTFVKVPKFVRGQPTMVVVRVPSEAEIKEYRNGSSRGVMNKRSGELNGAGDTLARSCWVYPPKGDAQKAMLSTFPGILSPIAVAALGLAGALAEEEGKD